tara:strand:- start:4897 stop:5223 length:327 start_codon:yes stop_codon:yes gene_type:complete
MAKLLETKLPVAIGPIDPALFNRLVRILELSLNKVNVGSTINVNESERNINQFNTGDVIWNLTTEQLQLWTGKQWSDIYLGTEKGVQGTMSLGQISVSTGGNTTIKIL